jgi:hypothetical protein
MSPTPTYERRVRQLKGSYLSSSCLDMQPARRNSFLHQSLSGSTSRREYMKDFYREHNIITIYLLAHSPHLLQPLDISYFRPLEKAYSYYIKELSRFKHFYINKEDSNPSLTLPFQDLSLKITSKEGLKALAYSSLKCRSYLI